MKQSFISGVATALVTPFLGKEINYPMAEQLIRQQIDAGIGAIVLSGTTGESPVLTDGEKLELFRRGKAYAGKNCRILAGTGSNSTEHTIALSVAAQETGVDGLLIVSPYYNKSTPEGLVGHYTAIARQVELPIILYNVPSRTGLDIPVSVYEKLSRIPNIIGVKEASTNITKITRIRNACGEDFEIYTGNDAMIVPAIACGAQGVVSVVSNVCPQTTRAMALSALSGDFETAAAIQCGLQELIDLLFREVSPIPVKAAMELAGFDCGGCRLPLGSPSTETREKLQDFFRRKGREFFV